MFAPSTSEGTLPFRRPGPEGQVASEGPSTAIEGSAAVQLDWSGQMSGDDLRRWNEANHPYKNLAGDQRVAERVLRYTRDRVSEYDTKTLTLQRKWQVLNYILQGNSIVNWEDPDGVHSPKIFQSLENLEARITDAVLSVGTGSSEWFQVRGREEMDWREERLIQGYFEYALDKNKWKARVPEVVRTMMTYGFAPLKVQWENRVEKVVERTREKTIKARLGPRWTTTRKEVKKVTYSGVRIEQIDPFWFMCDTSRTDPQEMLWIGERKRMTYEEILAKQESGEYLNARLLEEEQPKAWTQTFSDWARWSRSQTFPYDPVLGRKVAEGAPREFYVVEIWGLFDLYGTGLARECVLTVANGTTVLQVRENPFDNKMRPYAVPRACKYPFDFHSVGPLDHCIPLQIEIDTIRQLAVEGARLAVCPLVFTKDAANVGDSIYGVRPGQVFDVDPRNMQMTQIRSPVDDAVKAERMLSDDLHMTAGDPQLFLGGDSAGTMSATEFSGRIGEANKRVRSYIRSFTEGAEDVLSIMHELCAQNMMATTKFRVLGPAGAGLQTYEEVTPETFDADVDFDFVAIANLHVAGMEATNMQLFGNLIVPMLPMLPPDTVDLPEFVKGLGTMLLGDRAKKYIKTIGDPSMLMGQDEELYFLLKGQYVPVQPDDDDDEHLEVIAGAMEGLMDQPQEILAAIMRHAAEHEASKAQKQRAEKVRQQRAQQQQEQPLSFQGQGSPMTNMSRQKSNETNGPVNAQQVSSPGRSQGFFQEQNEQGDQ